jgi:CheY-like chemotaxis protein
MTAQNMGKKILTEAGYEVVAVSNGAAAVKKIAEQKPDIIILDVYMPGYSGLEVCEKVRGSLDTMKTPVLLTVGKMEPYKPEDANRVKADGVIIKPFEASDLLAIMKKFEERIAQTAVPPMVEQTVRLERQYQEEAIAAAAEPVEHHSTGKTGMQPMVEVPDHMAGAAAFNDMLSADSSMAAHHFGVSSPAAAFETSVIVPAPPIPTAEYELPVPWKEEEKPEPIATVPAETEPEIVATPVEAAAEPIPTEAEPETVGMEALPEPEASVIPAEPSERSSAGDAPEPSHPHFIPVYKEPEPQPEATAYEVLPTAAPPIGDIEIPREPELQETANETTRNTVADHVEPGLLSPQEKYSADKKYSADEKDQAPSWSSGSTATASNEEVPAPTMEIAPAESQLTPLPAIRAAGEVGDADFEARVAAAMAAYSHATEAAPAQTEVPESPVAAVAEVPAETSHTAQHVEAGPEAAPSFEYHPPVRMPEVVETAPATSADMASTVPEITASPTPQVHEAVTLEPVAVHDVVTAGVEAAAVAAAAETGADHHNIAQAIHRVMERLKPELVEEIMRELRSKK